MVELPGTLERSTLGDVLGALHRYRVTGTLLLEESGAGLAHRHLIAWRDGLIHHVETTRARRGGGPSASHRHATEHWTGDDARRSELLERLEALFELGRARLSFRVMGPRLPEATRPLGPREFLHGRRRSRDVPGGAPRASAPPSSASAASASAASSREAPRTSPPPSSQRALALRTLGLDGEPGVDVVRAAFRQLARRWHPDRHPGANEQTRAVLCRRFAQITGAYEALIGNGA